MDVNAKLAGATVPCDCGCHTDPSQPPRGCCGQDTGGCEGRVYLFAGVRVPCSQTDHRISHPCSRRDCGDPHQERAPHSHYRGNHYPECQCQGRGWTASTDGWVWWRAAKQVKIAIALELRLVEEHGSTAALTFVGGNVIDDRDPEVAFFATLEQKVAQIPGIEFGEPVKAEVPHD